MAETKKRKLGPPSEYRQQDYPVIGFGVALDLAKKIYGTNKMSPMRMADVCAAIGYANNGRTSRMIAALKKYALLEGDDGDLRVTREVAELSLSPEAFPASKLRDMAFRVSIFKEMATRYPGSLPSSGTVLLWLTADKKFAEDSAKLCLNAYKNTVTALGPSAVVVDAEQDKDDDDSGTNNARESSTMNANHSMPAVGAPDFSAPLGSRVKVEVRFVGGPPNVQRLNFLKDQIEMWARQMAMETDSSEAQETKENPQPA